MIQALKWKCNFLCCLGTLLGSHKRTYMHEFVIFKLWTSKVRFPFLIFFCLISLFITYVFKKMFSIALCDSFLFLIMQSRQVKGGVREARYISEAVVMGSGYLKISKIFMKSFIQFMKKYFLSLTPVQQSLFSKHWLYFLRNILKQAVCEMFQTRTSKYWMKNEIQILPGSPTIVTCQNRLLRNFLKQDLI